MDSSTADTPDRGASTRVVLRKCVGRSGDIAYQSAPCATSSRELWSREEERETTEPSSPLLKATQEDPRVLSNYAANRINGSGRRADTRVGARSIGRQRCEDARLEAARKRDREWNRLKFDDLSRLDAWVAERCR
ncbi:MAG: hypothetical protein ABIP49_04155 [Lysobacterales bacterium]